jgi:hypothetical protein
MRDAAIVRREEILREPAHHDRKPEGRKDLHHAGIGLGADRKSYNQEIDRGPEYEQRRCHQRRRQQGIDREEREQKERRIHRDHQKFAMGEIDDIHQAEDQRQPHGDQAVEQPHQKAAGETLNDGLSGHAPCPRFLFPVTSSARWLQQLPPAPGRW